MSKEDCNVELHFVVERGEIKQMKVNGDAATMSTALCFIAQERSGFAYALANALKLYFQNELTKEDEDDE
jgi:hypothetical protein